MNVRIIIGAATALLGLAPVARAQQPPNAPAQPPAVRALGRITSVAPDTFSAVSAAVQVAGGKVYVNDITAHRVLMFDSAMARSVVVADSMPGTVNAYGPRPGTLLPFHGDSALFISPASLSMAVLSPSGTVARVMAMPPQGNGIPALIGNIFGTPGFDANGRLAYYSPIRLQFRSAPNFQATGQLPVMEPPDSAYIVRFDFASRSLDTAGVLHIARSRSQPSRDDQGKFHVSITAFPPMTVDDWAVTSDGSIAVVRGRDYHVDWLNADGSWTSSPRMPYAWEHLNDDEKTTLIDSTAAALQTIMDSLPARMQRGGAAGGPGGPGGGPVVVAGERSGPPGGGGGGTFTVTVGPGVGDGGRGGIEGARGGGPGGPTTVSMTTPTVVKAALNDVPDYRPPFRQGSVRADLDGNLWIRTNKIVNGQPVFDIVNRRGELTDRVQLPPFRTIAGFGPGGTVYLGVRDSLGVMHLERARVR